jgi:hypothetical protein
MTFIPPAVDPLHPPMTINRTKKNLIEFGHKSKSTVAKPVAVIREIS